MSAADNDAAAAAHTAVVVVALTAGQRAMMTTIGVFSMVLLGVLPISYRTKTNVV